MKIYSGIKKRLAKKKLAKFSSNSTWLFNNLSLAMSLGEGDLIHSCRGYSEVIEDITPVAVFTKRGYVIYDFDIVMTSGNCCSYRNCCIYPLPSKKEVFDQWKKWADNAKEIFGDWNFGSQHNILIQVIKDGKDPFDDNGCIKDEYIYRGN